MQLKRIIEENDTPAGKVFDLFIQLLIVLLFGLKDRCTDLASIHFLKK